MNRWLQVALFLIGALLFGKLLADIGLPELRNDAVASGWMRPAGHSANTARSLLHIVASRPSCRRSIMAHVA